MNKDDWQVVGMDSKLIVDQLSDNWNWKGGVTKKAPLQKAIGTQIKLILADDTERHIFDVNSSTTLKALKFVVSGNIVLFENK